MSKLSTTPSKSTKRTDVDRLRAEVAGLRAELAELRTALTREVRTERLVVVAPDDGRELIYTKVTEDYVGLHVTFAVDGGVNPRYVEAQFGVNAEGEESMAFMDLAAGGRSVVELSAYVEVEAEQVVSYGLVDLGREVRRRDADGRRGAFKTTGVGLNAERGLSWGESQSPGW